MEMPVTRLFATASVEDHWRAVAGPWLRAQAASAWKETRPTVVLTPNRAEGFYLRSRLVAERVPLLGIRFWTPSDIRKVLLGHYLPKLATTTQAELRLLTRACAERLAKESTDDNASLKSVLREPAAFLRAYELLLGAGWDPAHDGAAYGRDLARELQRELEANQIATQAGVHRRLWREATSKPQPLIANLFVTGFNAAHWPLWDLLKAAVLSAEEVMLGFSEPGVFGESTDQLWISSWEEFTQTIISDPAAPMEGETAAPFAGLAASYESGSGDAVAADVTFRVTPDLTSQVRAVVLQALDYLRRDDCARLGIVFPQANALALGVAEELGRLNIPMNDGPGVLTPGIFEKRCWQTWLALQDEPGVPALIAWVKACQAEGISFGAEPGLSTETIVKTVDAALGKTLVDDLGFLARHLDGSSSRYQEDKVADFLRHRIALPPEETFARFLELTREALELRGWENFLAELGDEPPAWLRKSDELLSRRIFLEWLREATDSQSRTRGRDGNHFYGRVHLLVYGQLGGQAWSHLILTGLNEGVWPRVFEAGAFGSRHELMTLNRQARALNRRVRTEGRQGAGQEVVREGYGHCLLPLEAQDLALRDLCAALEATSGALCLTALAAESGRSLLPSDFFNHTYQVKTGRVLDEDAFRHLAQSTLEWCRRHEALFAKPVAAPRIPIEATRTAYDARRHPAQPFGQYEFAFDAPPERPVQLPCKQWEVAWNHPARIWLESVVGAPESPEGRLSWPGAVGTWVHDWLAQALRESRERKVTALLPLVRDAAERDARRVREQAAASAIPLCPWWDQVWSQARSVALGLAENLEPLLRDREFIAEVRLPSGLRTALPGSEHADFDLKGRIDLLLFDPGAPFRDPSQGDLAGAGCWVIDFKTGTATALSEKEISRGRGLQPLLYALALRALGAGPTAISLMTPNAALKSQLRLDDALRLAPVFRSLEILHRDGVFGMKPDADSDYGFSPAYPLATQFIPRHILDAKWALVHESLDGGGEADL
jgi:hypothetical protein